MTKNNGNEKFSSKDHQLISKVKKQLSANKQPPQEEDSKKMEFETRLDSRIKDLESTFRENHPSQPESVYKVAKSFDDFTTMEKGKFKEIFAYEMNEYFQKLGMNAKLTFEKHENEFNISPPEINQALTSHLKKMNTVIDSTVDEMIKDSGKKIPVIEKKNALKLKILENVANIVDIVRAVLPRRLQNIGPNIEQQWWKAVKKNNEEMDKINAKNVSNLSTNLRASVEEIKKSASLEKTKEPPKDKTKKDQTKWVSAKPTKISR